MRFILSSALLFICHSIQKTSAQSSTASWQFPLQDGFTIDVIDTIILQWTSNYKEAWLLMWCQKNGPGEDVSLGSEFRVQPNGSFPYILFSQNFAQRQFPVACHAQLAVEQKGTGVDGPVGITWTSRTGVEARTFSLAKKQVVTSTTRSSSAVTTTTSSRSTAASSTSVASSTPFLPSSTVALPVATSSTTEVPVVEPPSGLSPPVKLALGLGLGLSFLFVCLAGTVWFLFVRRSKTADGDVETKKRWTPSFGHAGFGRHELEDEPRRLHEMEGKGDSTVGKVELDSSERERAELEDSQRRKTLVGGELDGKQKSGRNSKKGHQSVYEMP